MHEERDRLTYAQEFAGPLISGALSSFFIRLRFKPKLSDEERQARYQALAAILPTLTKESQNELPLAVLSSVLPFVTARERALETHPPASAGGMAVATSTGEVSAATLVNFVPFGLGTRFVERPGDQPLQLNRWEKHYISRRARGAGENDLNALAAKPATTEEGFEYIEGRLGGMPVALWYEIGFDESEHRVFLERDPELIRGAQQVFDEVTAMSGYHYHPRQSMAHHESEYPSDGDFEELIWDGLFHKEVGLPQHYDRRVVTSTGVMIMTSNYAVIDQDQAGARRELERYKLILERYLDDEDPSLAPLTQQEKCRRFAEEVSSKFFTIHYRPFERKEKETNDGSG